MRFQSTAPSQPASRSRNASTGRSPRPRRSRAATCVAAARPPLPADRGQAGAGRQGGADRRISRGDRVNRTGVQSATTGWVAFGGVQKHHFAQRRVGRWRGRGWRVPPSDDPGVFARRGVVRDGGENPTQLNGGRELSPFVEGAPDRRSLSFGDSEHGAEHGRAGGNRQALAIRTGQEAVAVGLIRAGKGRARARAHGMNVTRRASGHRNPIRFRFPKWHSPEMGPQMRAELQLSHLALIVVHLSLQTSALLSSGALAMAQASCCGFTGQHPALP